MQGAFHVWTAHKKDKIRDIRFKPMQRHIFLYEKMVLFCKKKDDPQHVEKAAYIFKNTLDVSVRAHPPVTKPRLAGGGGGKGQ